MEASRETFSEFVTFCQSVTDNDYEVLKLVQKRFNKCKPEYIASEAFRELLEDTITNAKQDPANKYVYIKDFVGELKAYELKEHGKDAKRHHESSDSLPETKKKRRIELINLASKVNDQEDVESLNEQEDADSHISDNLSDKPEVAVLVEITSDNESDEKVTPHQSNDEDTEKESKRRVKHTGGKGSDRQIRKLETLLEDIRDEIEKLEMKELSLDDLDDSENTYVLIDKYKKKFVQVWKKLCQVKGRASTTGRTIERRFRFEGTRYPEINKKIEKFVNKFREFPDYHDIRDIVIRCNVRHKLKLSKSRIDSLARDAFTEVGNKLQERRQEDFRSTLESGVEELSSRDDPALHNRQLRQKLESNKQLGHNKMIQVIKKYAEKQENGDDTSDDDDEDDEDDEEEENDENDDNSNSTKTNKEESVSDENEPHNDVCFEEGQDLLDYKKFLLNDSVKEKNRDILNKILNTPKTKLKSPLKQTPKAVPIKRKLFDEEESNLVRNPLSAVVKLPRVEVFKSPVKVVSIKSTPNKNMDYSIIVLGDTPVKLNDSLSPVVKLKKISMNKDIGFDPFDGEQPTTSNDPTCTYMSYNTFSSSLNNDSIESRSSSPLKVCKETIINLENSNVIGSNINSSSHSELPVSRNINVPLIKESGNRNSEKTDNMKESSCEDSEPLLNSTDMLDCSGMICSEDLKSSQTICGDSSKDSTIVIQDTVLDPNDASFESSNGTDQSNKFEIYIDRACDDNYEHNLSDIKNISAGTVELDTNNECAIVDDLTNIETSKSKSTTDNQSNINEDIVSSTSDHVPVVSEDICTSTIEDNQGDRMDKEKRQSINESNRSGFSKSSELASLNVSSSNLKIKVSSEFRHKMKETVAETLSSKESCGNSSSEVSCPSTPLHLKKRKSFIDLECEKTLKEQEAKRKRLETKEQTTLDVTEEPEVYIIDNDSQQCKDIEDNELSKDVTKSIEESIEVINKDSKVSSNIDHKNLCSQKETVIEVIESLRPMPSEKEFNIKQGVEQVTIRLSTDDIIIDDTEETEFEDRNTENVAKIDIDKSGKLNKVVEIVTKELAESESSCSNDLEAKNFVTEKTNNDETECLSKHGENLKDTLESIEVENEIQPEIPKKITETNEDNNTLVNAGNLVEANFNDKNDHTDEVSDKHKDVITETKDSEDTEESNKQNLAVEVLEESSISKTCDITKNNSTSEINSVNTEMVENNEKNNIDKNDDLASLAQALVQQAVTKLKESEAESIVQRALEKLKEPLPISDKESNITSKGTSESVKNHLHDKELLKCKASRNRDDSVEILDTSLSDSFPKEKHHKHKKKHKEQDYAVKIVSVSKPKKSIQHVEKKDIRSSESRKFKKLHREDSVTITGVTSSSDSHGKRNKYREEKSKMSKIDIKHKDRHINSHKVKSKETEKKKKNVARDDDVSIVEVIDDDFVHKPSKHPKQIFPKVPNIPPVQRICAQNLPGRFSATSSNMDSIIKSIANKVTLEKEIDNLRKETHIQKLNLSLNRRIKPSDKGQIQPARTDHKIRTTENSNGNLPNDTSIVPVRLHQSNPILTSTPIVPNSLSRENLANTVSVTRIKRKLVNSPEIPNAKRTNLMGSPNVSCIQKIDNIPSTVVNNPLKHRNYVVHSSPDFRKIAETITSVTKKVISSCTGNEPTSTRDDLSEEEVIGSSGQPPELGDPSSVIILEDSD